jgi:XrtN system VIT domain protein
MKILKLKNRTYRSGLACLAASLLFFCLPFWIPQKEGSFPLFVANFGITIGYFVLMLADKKNVLRENRIHNIFLFLILFFISAWSLNREMTVFEDSADWFSALLVVLCSNYLAFAYAAVIPKWTTHILSFIAGVSCVTFIYLSLYLFPLYAVGMIGFFLIGISLHTFVPLLFTIYTFVLMNRVSENNKRYWLSFAGGFISVVAFVACYVGLWNTSKKQLDHAWQEGSIHTDGLPAWVNVAQKVPSGFFLKKILKTEFMYSTPGDESDNFLWRVPVRNFGEQLRHDPLVMTAAFLTGTPKMETDTKIKILESLHGLRHEGQERLWVGDHLFTKQVNTEVKVWPACNIAYTEKTLTVTNGNKATAWRNQEEAIYTFHLPEGGVVTSLSLWINGKEEKGIMTTKAKADTAYKEIVGVQRRDPSVVHWQEGNTVSLRVFPVFAGESRKFKIGITAPLEKVNGKLRYENVYFKGPSFENATENILFDFEQPATDYQLPASFVSMSEESYKREGKYEPVWSMLINDRGLSDCSFSFDKNTYSLAPYHKKLSPARLDAVYIDVNKSWTRNEYDRVIELANAKDVFVYDSEMIKLRHDNKEECWQRMRRKQFSLFPLFEISDPVHSLLVTKSPDISPGIDDLDGSDFMKKTKAFLAKGEKIKLFDLGDELSLYLRSLKEFRVFQYDKGDIRSLTDMVTKELFPDDLENNEQVIIHKSDMIIRRKEEIAKSSGPDHLMRLFTYNHIMQILGTGLLTDRLSSDSLADEAHKAYVVSPVSSLIVLETQQDYDRFNINDDGASLKNASLKSKGAVPEPHEWVLIIVALLVLMYVMRMKKPGLTR